MEYFTSKEQELIIEERYRKKIEQEQDRIRNSLFRYYEVKRYEPEEEDRIFFVEPCGNVYLGEVKEKNKCPTHHVQGGRCYEIDSIFLKDVQEFVRNHSRYVIIFRIRKGYSYRAGIYPARIVSDDNELILENYLE